MGGVLPKDTFNAAQGELPEDEKKVDIPDV